jgi:hypothetical protein
MYFVCVSYLYVFLSYSISYTFRMFFVFFSKTYEDNHQDNSGVIVFRLQTRYASSTMSVCYLLRSSKCQNGQGSALTSIYVCFVSFRIVFRIFVDISYLSISFRFFLQVISYFISYVYARQAKMNNSHGLYFVFCILSGFSYIFGIVWIFFAFISYFVVSRSLMAAIPGAWLSVCTHMIYFCRPGKLTRNSWVVAPIHEARNYLYSAQDMTEESYDGFQRWKRTRLV